MEENEQFNTDLKLSENIIANRINDDKNSKNEPLNPFFSEEFSLNGKILKNRYCFFNMTDAPFSDTELGGKKMLNFYNKIANSGVGLIFNGGAYAGKLNKNSKRKTFKLNYSKHEENLHKELTSVVQAHGTKIFFKINSIYGRADDYNKKLNIFPYSVSRQKQPQNPMLSCSRISDGKCDKLILEMANMAKFAIKTGYDGVLIDGSLYGLIGEFSSGELNIRKFGYYNEIIDFSKKLLLNVSYEIDNREVFYDFSFKTFIREIFGKEVKNISVFKKFYDNKNNSSIFGFLEKLVELGVTGFVFRLGTHETEFLSDFCSLEEKIICLNFYEKVIEYFNSKNILTKFKSKVVFVYHDNFSFPITNENLCREEFLFDVTKYILSNENILSEIKNNTQTKRCIKCSMCSKVAKNNDSIFCSINPGIDYFETESKNNDNEKVAIIGSGIAGLNCAIELAKRNIHVDIYEKNNEINLTGRIYEIFGYDKDFENYNKYLNEKIEEFKKLGLIRLYLNNEFGLKDSSKINYQKVVVATGARERNFNISGAVLKSVISIFDVLKSEKFLENKRNIVLYANSELSLKTAIYLQKCGKTVSIIIENVNMLRKITNSKLSFYLYALSRLGVKVYLGARIKRIESDFVELIINRKLKDKNFVSVVMNMKSKTKYKFEPVARCLDLDLFIFEPERKPNNRLFYDIIKSGFGGRVYMIGDALSSSDTVESIKTAFYVSKNI